jgi:tungstate transport system substrate-binding protein
VVVLKTGFFAIVKSSALVLVLVAFALGFFAGYMYKHHGEEGSSEYAIRVSTTTSLYQTGLLKDLLEDFRNFSGLNVKFDILARGSGEALRLLADGSTCIAFTHAPSLELAYINRGEVERLTIFAINEFLIVGPSEDPAGVSGVSSAVDAFKRIFNAGEKRLAKFISRGDYSGTHVRELLLWNLTGLDPEGRPWYIRSAKGMAETLIMADNMKAYTLTDVGTFRSLQNRGKVSNLIVLHRDPTYLINAYSLYLSKAKSCDNPITWYVAYKLREYLLMRGQELIAQKYKDLFNPVKGSERIAEKAWEELAKLRS